MKVSIERIVYGYDTALIASFSYHLFSSSLSVPNVKIDKESGELEVEQSLSYASSGLLKEDSDAFVYDLMATVNHIKDSKTNGNFVAHIRVKITCLCYAMSSSIMLTSLLP